MGPLRAGIGRHARPSWITATVVLIGCAALLTGLKADGLTTTDSFTNKPDAVVGQKIFDASFDSGAGAPAVIIANANQTDAVIQAASKVPGVAQTPGSVCVQVDYAKLAKLPPAARASLGQGCAPAALQVAAGRRSTTDQRDHELPLRHPPGRRRSFRTSERRSTRCRVRTRSSAARRPSVRHEKASAHDRNLIIPIVLVVILVVLAMVLRAILVPMLLIVTVVLSFAATLGVSAFVFNHIFDFDNADPAFPLFAFVFLVALGIDYNIFLMTRVREETLEVRHSGGHRSGPGGDRRCDHVRRPRARGDLRGSRRAAAGVLG